MYKINVEKTARLLTPKESLHPRVTLTQELLHLKRTLSMRQQHKLQKSQF